MFDKLLDALISALERITFVSIMPQYDRGVILRAGRFHRRARPGIVWQWPLLERLLTATVVPTTEQTRPQVVTTADGRTIVYSLAVTWRVARSQRYLLHLYDGAGAVLDCLAGASGQVVAGSPRSAQLTQLAEQIEAAANARARQWGVRFERVAFADFADASVHRLVGDGVKPWVAE